MWLSMFRQGPTSRWQARTHQLFTGCQCFQNGSLWPSHQSLVNQGRKCSSFFVLSMELIHLKQSNKNQNNTVVFLLWRAYIFPFMKGWWLPFGAVSCPLKTWQFCKSSFWHFTCWWNQMSGNDHCPEIFTLSLSSSLYGLLGKTHKYRRSVLPQAFPKINRFLPRLLVVVRNIASGRFIGITPCAEA